MAVATKSRKVSKVINHINRGIEDFGGTTSPDFSHEFSKEFRSMMKEQIEKVGGTNYKQNVGHYYISGFFTVGEQPYYFSISDVRYAYPHEKYQMLIRTAKDYKDYTGGSNHFIEIADNIFVGNLPR